MQRARLLEELIRDMEAPCAVDRRAALAYKLAQVLFRLEDPNERGNTKTNGSTGFVIEHGATALRAASRSIVRTEVAIVSGEYYTSSIRADERERQIEIPRVNRIKGNSNFGDG